AVRTHREEARIVDAGGLGKLRHLQRGLVESECDEARTAPGGRQVAVERTDKQQEFGHRVLPRGCIAESASTARWFVGPAAAAPSPGGSSPRRRLRDGTNRRLSGCPTTKRSHIVSAIGEFLREIMPSWLSP